MDPYPYFDLLIGKKTIRRYQNRGRGLYHTGFHDFTFFFRGYLEKTTGIGFQKKIKTFFCPIHTRFITENREGLVL